MDRRIAWRYLRNVVLFHLLWVAAAAAFDLVLALQAPSESFVPELYVALLPLFYGGIAAILLPISLAIGTVVLWVARRSTRPRRLIAIGTATAIWAAALAIQMGIGRGQPDPRFLELAVPACLIYGVLMPLPPDGKP